MRPRWRCNARCSPPSTRWAAVLGRADRRPLRKGRHPRAGDGTGPGRAAAGPRGGRAQLGLRRGRRALARSRRGDGAAERRRGPRCRVHPALRARCIRPASRGGWPTRSSGGASRSTSAPGSRRSRRGRVATSGGRVRADVVVRATEGYTARIPDHRRTLAPLYSLMIATEPLPSSFWADRSAGRAGDVQRRSPPHHLRAAHRGRPHRVRRSGRAVPLRQSRARRVRPRPARSSRSCTTSSPASSPRSPTWRSPTAGAVRSASLATGTRSVGFEPHDRPRAGPAATSATAWARATWPDGRWPTSSSARHRPHPAAVGRAPVAAVGARAVPVARHQRGAPPHRRTGPDRGAHRSSRPLARTDPRSHHGLIVGVPAPSIAIGDR